MDPHSRTDRFGVEKNLLPLPGFESRIVKSISWSVYSDVHASSLRVNSNYFVKLYYPVGFCNDADDSI